MSLFCIISFQHKHHNMVFVHVNISRNAQHTLASLLATHNMMCLFSCEVDCDFVSVRKGFQNTNTTPAAGVS